MGRRGAFFLGISACVLGGCALILGFEDTTLAPADPDAAEVDGGGKVDAPAEVDTGVDAATSSVTVTPDPALLQRGQSVTVTITIDRAGRDGVVPFTLVGLPSGVTASGPTAIADGATKVDVKLTAAAGAALGSANVTVGAGALGSTVFAVTVSAAPGTPDETFDVDGVVADAARGNASTFYAVAQQTDGRIVAGGFAAVGGALPPSGWLLRRFAAGGAPDTAFNGAVTGLPGDGEIRALAFDAAGNILCAGTSRVPATLVSELTVMRFKSTGLLDTTFGAGGTFRVPVATAPTGSEGLGIALQPSGAIIVVGSRKDVAGESGWILRLTSAGALDAGFAGGQILVPKARLVGVAIEANGAILAGGTDADANAFLLMKRGVDGAVDPAFGVGGTSKIGGSIRGNGFARLADGTLAVVGESIAGDAFTAARVAATGAQLYAGVVRSLPGAGYQGVASGTAGTFLATGFANGAPNGTSVVDRLQGDGGLDRGFGDGGTFFLGDPSSPDNYRVSLYGIASQRDGRILAAGNVSNAGAVVVRLWP